MTSLFAQSSSILMKVGDDIVSKNEFVSAYKKNFPDGVFSKKRLRSFANQYALYKMKCMEVVALKNEEKMPLTSTLLSEKNLTATLNATLGNDLLAQSSILYNKVKQEVKAKGGVRRGTELFVALPQMSSKAQEEQAKQTMMQLSEHLRNVPHLSNFDVSNFSTNGVKVEKRIIPWTTKEELLPEIEDVLFALKPQERSKAFLAVDGWHIIELEEAKDFPDYSEVENNLLTYLKQQIIRQYFDKELVTLSVEQRREDAKDSATCVSNTILTSKKACSKNVEPADLELQKQVVHLQQQVINRKIAENKNAINDFEKRYSKKIISKKEKHSLDKSTLSLLIKKAYEEYLLEEWERSLQQKYSLLIDKKVLKSIK